MNEVEYPLVSVVVPCYNHEKYVEECILSIVNQTYKNIELIVIDDGSKDNSVEIIKKLSDKFGFYFEAQKNMGLTATLNKSIPITKGKYICFLASDDYWPLDKIEKQIQVMERNSNVAVAYGIQQDVSINGQLGRITKANYKSGNIFKELLTWEFAIPALTAMIRKEVFEDVGSYDEALPIEDFYMWLKIADKYRFEFIDSILGYYRIVPGSLSKNIKPQIKAKEIVIDLWQDSEYYNEAIYKQNIISFWKLSRSFKKESLKYFFKILKFQTLENKLFYKGIVKLLFTK
jgi:glycosyltransferase involved in cell wall biosynthesis